MKKRLSSPFHTNIKSTYAEIIKKKFPKEEAEEIINKNRLAKISKINTKTYSFGTL